jgi:hypothetical protein
MSLWSIVFLGKCFSGQSSSRQMSFWANVFLGKRPSGQMSSGQMSFWANVFLGKCFLGKCRLGKCLSRKMSFWANFVWANILLGKRRMGKCIWANVVWINVMEPSINTVYIEKDGEPNQTFDMVLVPALTKMEVKFVFYDPPLWARFDTPKTVETGTERREIQFKAEGPFLASAVLPF